MNRRREPNAKVTPENTMEAASGKPSGFMITMGAATAISAVRKAGGRNGDVSAPSSAPPRVGGDRTIWKTSTAPDRTRPTPISVTNTPGPTSEIEENWERFVDQ